MYNKVRINEEEMSNQNMKSTQIAMNKMVRMVEGVSLKGHITTVSLLNQWNLPSVNQLAAEIKLVETWKIMKIPDYPLKLNQNNPNKVLTQRTIRPTSVKQWKDNAKLKCAQESFSIDAARLWNKAPQSIHMAESLQIAKKNIKNWCSQMAIWEVIPNVLKFTSTL